MRKRQAGQTLVIAALGLTVLMLAAGLAVDMGYLRYEKRRMQTAADSAAIAGASEMQYTDWSTAAQTDATANGFTNGANGATVTPNEITCPDGTANCVQVVVSQQAPTFFMRVVGINSETVAASAVAELGKSPNCIYALGPSPGGIQFGGFNTDVQAATCALIDSGDLCIPAPSYILDTLGSVYAGSYDSCSSSSGYGSADPAPVQGAQAGNPLLYLSNNTPSVGIAGTSCGYTYCAGSYPMGIPIVGTGQTVTFQPGTYVLGGSGLTISGSGTVTGSGVTFYTNGSGAFSINSGTDYGSDSCPASGPPTNTTGMTVQLSAPTDPTNPYGGVLFIQDDSQPSTAPPSTITLNNGDTCGGSVPTTLGTSSYLWGVLYLPSAQLTLIGTGADSDDGCSTIPRFTIVVAYTLIPEGNLNFGVSDCPFGSPASPYTFATPLPDPIKDAVLVE